MYYRFIRRLLPKFLESSIRNQKQPFVANYTTPSMLLPSKIINDEIGNKIKSKPRPSGSTTPQNEKMKVLSWRREENIPLCGIFYLLWTNTKVRTIMTAVEISRWIRAHVNKAENNPCGNLTKWNGLKAVKGDVMSGRQLRVSYSAI